MPWVRSYRCAISCSMVAATSPMGWSMYSAQMLISRCVSPLPCHISYTLHQPYAPCPPSGDIVMAGACKFSIVEVVIEKVKHYFGLVYDFGNDQHCGFLPEIFVRCGHRKAQVQILSPLRRDQNHIGCTTQTSVVFPYLD